MVEEPVLKITDRADSINKQCYSHNCQRGKSEPLICCFGKKLHGCPLVTESTTIRFPIQITELYKGPEFFSCGPSASWCYIPQLKKTPDSRLRGNDGCVLPLPSLLSTNLRNVTPAGAEKVLACPPKGEKLDLPSSRRRHPGSL